MTPREPTARPAEPDPPRDWILRLRPLPDPGGAPVACKVRRLLKYALRACGLRCVDVREATAENLPPTTVDK